MFVILTAWKQGYRIHAEQIQASCNVATRQFSPCQSPAWACMPCRELIQIFTESDMPLSTADFGCRYVNNVWHHAHRSGVHNIIMAGDCIEGSSMGPTIGAISSHVISPFPQRAHTPPSQQQQLKWQALMVNEWYGLCDGALQDM